MSKRFFLFLAGLMALVLLFCGCGKKQAVTLYLPSGERLSAVTARVVPTPEGLVAALTQADALPDASGSYLYCQTFDEDGAVTVRLDISDALGQALRRMDNAQPAVQALANTFLDFYGAEVFVLTVEGVNLETVGAYYDHGIVVDEYVPLG